MGSNNLPLRNIGIYHNLPDFDKSLTGLTAIVTGANGISGFGTLRALLDAPHRWSKIYCLSRKPTPSSMLNLLSEEQRSKVQHVAVDFLNDPSKIAEALENTSVKADYIFFYSYLQPSPPPGSPPWSNADELVKVNTTLLQNFLSALPLASIKPKRFLLQTGAKNYGVHLGRARTPAIESDPQPSHLDPNFYYPQEAALFKYSKDQNVPWNVVMPAWIIGATTAAAMNALFPFAVYAAVQAKLGRKLEFFGDFDAWQGMSWHSCARLTGYLSEWAVLNEHTENQRFNATDGSPFSWDRFYSQLAEEYNVKDGVVPPKSEEEGGQYMEIKGKPGKDTPLGYGPPTVMRLSGSFVQWAQQPENSKAWKELMEESGGHLGFNPFDDVEAHFTFGDAASLSMVLCRNKAQVMGWTGFVDTHEGVFEMYREMGSKGLGMLPDMTGEESLALI